MLWCENRKVAPAKPVEEALELAGSFFHKASGPEIVHLPRLIVERAAMEVPTPQQPANLHTGRCHGLAGGDAFAGGLRAGMEWNGEVGLCLLTP